MDVSSWVSMPMSSFTGGYCSGVRVAATGEGGERDTRGSDPPVRAAQRPVACAPRSVMTVELARATSRRFSSTTSHSTSPIVRPPCTTRPVAVSFPVQTGLRKLILSSSVVNVSPSSSVDAQAIPIAASAMSQRTPPWSVPIGFAWRGVASNSTTAQPGSTEASVEPMSAATGGGATSPRCIMWMRSSIFVIEGSSTRASDEHREDHRVRDEESRHRERRDVVRRAQAHIEPEALGERVDEVDGPHDVEGPAQREPERPPGPPRDDREERQQRGEQVAVGGRDRERGREGGREEPTTVGTRNTSPRWRNAWRKSSGDNADASGSAASRGATCQRAMSVYRTKLSRNCRPKI